MGITLQTGAETSTISPQALSSFFFRLSFIEYTSMASRLVMVVVACGVMGYVCDALASGPTVSIRPNSVNVYFIQGKPLILTCSVHGDISEDVKWVRNELPIDGNEFQIESWSDEDEKGPRKNIKITKQAATPQDAAVYRCYSGSADETVSTSDFYVFIRNANITENSDTTLTCKPELPSPNKTVKWYQGDTPLEQVPDLKDRLEFGNDTVVFHNSKLTDSGIYTCRVELGAITEYIQVFEEKVELQGKPYIANWNNPELNQQVTNYSILLKCPAGGYPTPVVFWFREGEVIESSDHIKLTTLNGLSYGQLEISNTTEADYGQYKCTAENALGTASLTFDVTGSPAGNSGFRAMFGLMDVCGMFVGISIVSMTFPWTR